MGTLTSFTPALALPLLHIADAFVLSLFAAVALLIKRVILLVYSVIAVAEASIVLGLEARELLR